MKYIVLFIVYIFPSISQCQTITTYAGTGAMAYFGHGGPASNAGLIRPVGLGLDNSGNLLVCSQGYISTINSTTHIIEKIGGDSAVSFGDGGPASSALINDPRSICTDRNGNLYVADYWARTIRKISVDSLIIRSYVGTLSSPGFSGDGGPASNAKVNGVFAICCDQVSNILYIADTYNYRIRKVDINTGIISTFAGTGSNGYSVDNVPATNAKISRAIGICLDKQGNVYFGDWDNARIRKVDISTGIISTFAGSGLSGFDGDGGPATIAKIAQPSGMCFDTCGNFYFSDCGIAGGANFRIRKIDVETGRISTIAGIGSSGFGGDGGPATSAQFSRTNEIRIDKHGNLYVADIDNNRVRKITPDVSSCYNETSVAIVDSAAIIPNLFPNPATTTLTLSSPYEMVTVAISNLVGEIVYTAQYSGTRRAEIPTGHLPSGMYLIKVNERWVQRFMKE